MGICRGADGRIKIVDFQDDYSLESITPEFIKKLANNNPANPSLNDITPEELLASYCEDGIMLTKELFEFGPTR